MPRFIDAEKIDLKIPFEYAGGDIFVSIGDVKKAIAQTPTEDVVTRRIGRWIRKTDFVNFTHYICSECGAKEQIGGKKFCSECGACMVGGVCDG